MAVDPHRKAKFMRKGDLAWGKRIYEAGKGKCW